MHGEIHQWQIYSLTIDPLLLHKFAIV
jgi:hypothetical protein